MSVQDNLQKVIDLSNKATEGPWSVDGRDSGHSQYEMLWWVSTKAFGDTVCDMDAPMRLHNESKTSPKDDGFADAELIVNTRTNAPLMSKALLSILELHKEDLFRGHLSNGCVVCGPAPTGPAYPCKTVELIKQSAVEVSVFE